MGFFEEFLPISEEKYMIAFVVLLLIMANPITMIVTVKGCTFQSHSDTKIFCVQCCNTMLSCILMILTFHRDDLMPNQVLTAACVCFIFFYYLFEGILLHQYNSIVKKITSVYHYNRPVLPPLSPYVFTSPETVHVGLSQDAYSVVQSFASLNIKSSAEFHRFVGVGTAARLTAVTNLDFIKWGLSEFHDYNTVVDTAQICDYFGDKQQILPILLQFIGDKMELSFFKNFIINIIHSKHTDVISDNPPLLNMLQTKAQYGLSRCRRAQSLFWTAVLNHSQSGMKEGFCKLRDSITETKSHFDELCRCYPYVPVTMALHISFLTEIKCYFSETENYINALSAHYINTNSVENTNEDPMQQLNDMLQDRTQTYSRYTNNLSTYMEQERLSNIKTNRPMIALWSICIISLAVIIICLFTIILKTLIVFQTYPNYVSIVNSCTNVISAISSLTISSRRICLFSKNLIKTEDKTVPFGNTVTDASVYDNATVLLPYLIENAEKISNTLEEFYSKTSYSDDMLRALETSFAYFQLYGNKYNGSLSFGLDMMGNMVRSIAGNVPSLFQGIQLMGSFTSFMNFQNKIMLDNIERKYAKTHPLNISHSNERVKFTYNSKEYQYDPLELYATTCQSPQIYQLILNFRPLTDLLSKFLDEFLVTVDKEVSDFDKIMYYSMILLPLSFIFLFVTAVIITSYFVIQESNFRTTLYMSLPEQVALEVSRQNDGRKQINAPRINLSSVKKNEAESKGNLNSNSVVVHTMSMDSISQKSYSVFYGEEEIQIKEKAYSVENLRQFSSSNIAYIKSTGIKHFILWSIIYILYGALFMFVLTFYARTVNKGFYSRSCVIYDSCSRLMRIFCSTIYTSEFFFQDPEIKLVDTKDAYEFSKQQLDLAINLHDQLTYGSTENEYDFTDFPGIKAIMTKTLNEKRMNVPTEAFPSYGTIQHDGYKQFGFDTKFRVYTSFLSGLNGNFNKDPNSFMRNDPVWEEFDHFFFGHLVKDINETNIIYIDSVTTTIDESFQIALGISIISLIILIVIFFWPIRLSLKALQGYFDLTFHILCGIQPRLFNRSLYINKWIKGQISFFNYRHYENSFKRTVSPHLQSIIIEESSEKLIAFDINGKYIPVQEGLDVGENPTLQTLLSIYCDLEKDSSLLQNVKTEFQSISDAKDKMDSVNIKTVAKDGHPVKITIKGIQATDTKMTSANIQRFYSYIVLIFKDITQEVKERDEYLRQKERALTLLSSCIPKQFAQRLHKGEQKIVFSSGIGSVVTLEICDFLDSLGKMSISDLSVFLTEYHNLLSDVLKEFQNLSLIIFSTEKVILAAGLFNEEQNGRTEAIDSVNFIARFNPQLLNLLKKYNVSNEPKYAISTGGPICCKLLLSVPPVIMISDETANLSQELVKLAKPNMILIDRTTYECIYGLSIEGQINGDIEFNNKKVFLYSFTIESLNVLVNNSS